MSWRFGSEFMLGGGLCAEIFTEEVIILEVLKIYGSL